VGETLTSLPLILDVDDIFLLFFWTAEQLAARFISRHICYLKIGCGGL